MPLTKETHDLLIDCMSFLETDRSKLTAFEIDFFEDRYMGKPSLLERMYDKVVNGIQPQRRR